MRLRNRAPLVTLAVLAGVFGPGCAGDPRGDLAGAVVLNGSPVAVGQVTAYNDKDEPIGRVAIVDGRYEMTGLQPGAVTLVVQTHSPDGQPITDMRPPPRDGQRPLPNAVVKKDGDAAPPAKIDPVPLKYTTPKQSGLKAAVVKGPTVFDISMTGKGEVPKMPVPGPSGPPGSIPPGVPPPPGGFPPGVPPPPGMPQPPRR